MVVPVGASGSAPVNLNEIKRYVGNNLQLKFPDNRCTIVVIGNNVSLKIVQNFGLVKVIGNNCTVNIVECGGSVEYVGNNGKICFEGGEVGSDKVTYVGSNGSLLSKKAKRDNKQMKSTTGKKPTTQNNHVIVNHAIVVENNVRIKNPCIKVNLEDLNRSFPWAVLTA